MAWIQPGQKQRHEWLKVKTAWDRPKDAVAILSLPSTDSLQVRIKTDELPLHEAFAIDRRLRILAAR